ncbi:MAG: cupredoxin family copper-binding protein [Xanthomonadaceae bacterium]|nr:cupredoxin family copper-binding protein [Xanthomonadaceae bacterium]MDE2053259.1 cupredoxin family copper-binding protein [Xanthomonadaceae bacterium]MDE2225040.1 cupredoxin family copper-binding protein [Xanthomonadaceae bacterium]MDE2497994.1 cupredoxin family copper-binding protein [Xanthomonadaceae bacterium]
MRWQSIAFAALLPFAFVAQATSPAKPAAAYQVGIRNFRFQPKQIVVPAGATVTWANHDEEPHVITSAGNRFKGSPAMDTGDTWSAVFTRPGTYAYFCSVHPFMTGTIVVR